MTSLPVCATIEFVSQNSIAWGPSVLKPLSHCVITYADDANGASMVQTRGCAYCSSEDGNAVWAKLRTVPLPPDVASELSTYEDLVLSLCHKNVIATGQTTEPSIARWNPWLHGTHGSSILTDVAQQCNLSLEIVSCAISGLDAALWRFVAACRAMTLEKVLEIELLKSLPEDQPISDESSDLGILHSGIFAYCTAEIPFYHQKEVMDQVNYMYNDASLEHQKEWIYTTIQKKLESLLAKNFRAIKVYIESPFGNFKDHNESDRITILQQGIDLLRFVRRIVGFNCHLMFDSMAFQTLWNTVNDTGLDWARTLRRTLREEQYEWLEEPISPSDGPSPCRYFNATLSETLLRGQPVDYEKAEKCELIPQESDSTSDTEKSLTQTDETIKMRTESHEIDSPRTPRSRGRSYTIMRSKSIDIVQNANISSQKISTSNKFKGLYLSGCESLLGLDAFDRWYDAVDIFQPDVTVVGGISIILQLQQRILSTVTKKNHNSNHVKYLIPHGFSDTLGFNTDVALVSAFHHIFTQWCNRWDRKEEIPIVQRLVELPEHVLDGLSDFELDTSGHIVKC